MTSLPELPSMMMVLAFIATVLFVHFVIAINFDKEN
jgi:hypothetical protein